MSFNETAWTDRSETPPLLNFLHLDPESAERRRSFLSAYSEHLERYTVGAPSHELWQRIEPDDYELEPYEATPPASEDRSLQLADIAIEQAQLAVLTGDGRAVESWWEAGRLLQELPRESPRDIRQALGEFLLSAPGWPDTEKRDRDAYAGLLNKTIEAGRTESILSGSLIYLLLAAVGDPEIRKANAHALNTVAEIDLSRFVGEHRMGSLGISAPDYWRLGQSLWRIAEDYGPYDYAEQYALDQSAKILLSAMCRMHAEAISRAMQNRYLWDNFAASVDLVDLDVVGTAAIMSRIIRRPWALAEYAPFVALSENQEQIEQKHLEIGFSIGAGKHF